MSKHSPGPWEIEPWVKRGTPYDVITNGVNMICELHPLYPPNPACDAANAALLVAAPALLKALADLVNVINLDSDQEYFICSEASDIVDAARQLVFNLEVNT